MTLIAGQILLKEDTWSPWALAGWAPAKSLPPGMRAVHVKRYSKDHALRRTHSGRRQCGCLFDMSISPGNGHEPTTKVAPIALGVPVIFKRDRSLPDWCCRCRRTSRSSSHLRLIPTGQPLSNSQAGQGTNNPHADRHRIPGPRRRLKTFNPDDFNIESSKEYKNESKRIKDVLNGDRGVGDADLERIFNLPTAIAPQGKHSGSS